MVFELMTLVSNFRGHLLGKTTCSMLQLVLISDLHFPPRSDMFDFAFSTSEIYKQGVPGMITGLAPTKTPVIHL